MKTKTIISVFLALISYSAIAQTITETFDANSMEWTECTFKNATGTAIIDNGVFTIKSKGAKEALSVLLSVATGNNAQVGQNTFFETHCYAPIDTQKPFTIKSMVALPNGGSSEGNAGLVFNYKDNGNFYAFAFNAEGVEFLRYENNILVGSIKQSVKWPNGIVDAKKTKTPVFKEWKLESNGDILTFIVEGLEILKVRYMPLAYSGFGYYSFGGNELIVDSVEFIQ